MPPMATEMDPVSSETMTTTASEFSLMPIPARWRIPRSRDKFTFLAQGQHAACAQHPAAADDDGAVMHGSLDKEDILKELAGSGGVQYRAAADHVVQQDFPLKDNQRTGAGLRHLRAGQDGLTDGLLQRVPDASELVKKAMMRRLPICSSTRRISG